MFLPIDLDPLFHLDGILSQVVTLLNIYFHYYVINISFITLSLLSYVQTIHFCLCLFLLSYYSCSIIHFITSFVIHFINSIHILLRISTLIILIIIFRIYIYIIFSLITFVFTIIFTKIIAFLFTLDFLITFFVHENWNQDNFFIFIF